MQPSQRPAKKRAISYKMNKAARYPHTTVIRSVEWMQETEEQTLHLLRDLERAVRDWDYDRVCRSLGSLKAYLAKTKIGEKSVIQAYVKNLRENDVEPNDENKVAFANAMLYLSNKSTPLDPKTYQNERKRR